VSKDDKDNNTNNEVIKDTITKETTNLIKIISKIIGSNIKFILVFVAGFFMGIIINSRDLNSINSKNIGCIFLCEYSPIYNDYNNDYRGNSIENDKYNRDNNKPKKIGFIDIKLRRDDLL
jgi:hypothetical protein